MAINNKKVDDMIKEAFTQMEKSLNVIEESLSSGEAQVDIGKIGFLFGKIYENYKLVVDLLGIYKRR